MQVLAFSPDRAVPAFARSLELAVIVPTFNEGGNVGLLLERLAEALHGIAWEAIFVDDGSTDDTVPILTSAALNDPRVRLIRRFGRRGLSSAVIEGMLASAAPVLAVIDGDLQHDERILPKLLDRIVAQGADMAIGTRYAPGGSAEGWQNARLKLSRLATQVAGSVLRVRLSDPMSGFFAIRRDAFLASLPKLSSLGYKIMLDIVASAPKPLQIREEPYQFRPRVAGQSKLDVTIVLEYGLLLADKTIGRFIPLRFLMFLCVGSLGLLVNLAFLAALEATHQLPFWIAQGIAVCGAMTFNFLVNNVFTYRDRRLKGWMLLRGLLAFYLACSLGGVANVMVGSIVIRTGGGWWMAGTIGAIVGALWNYAASSVLTWKR
jgi:dolichol-phosphate mannosyltransferase